MSRYQEIKEMYSCDGYKFYEGEFAINLYGIRKGYDVVNEFDDILGAAFQDSFGNGVVIESQGTTKPGLHWLKNKKGNVNGTAILQPGQYLRCWQIGLHNGKYSALRQVTRFNVWRDGDSDGEFDIDGDTYTDVTGLNMHTTSFVNEIEKVGAYSAGCQVRKHHEDHELVMAILNRAKDRWDNDIFSYTLFEL